ncbi:MAG: hypothetical protein LUG65_02200 [Clostridiales bacterium]|nr:hypothetical protein [Clostridiales bacterium]
MGEVLQKIATFAIGGANTLGGWVTSLVMRVYNVVDQSMYRYHGRWAWCFLAVVILLLAGFVFQFVWKPLPGAKPGEKAKLSPKPYRLLFLCAALGIVFLAACLAGMN